MPSIDLTSMKHGQELLKRGFETMQEGGVIMDELTQMRPLLPRMRAQSQ